MGENPAFARAASKYVSLQEAGARGASGSAVEIYMAARLTPLSAQQVGGTLVGVSGRHHVVAPPAQGKTWWQSAISAALHVVKDATNIQSQVYMMTHWQPHEG